MSGISTDNGHQKKKTEQDVKHAMWIEEVIMKHVIQLILLSLVLDFYSLGWSAEQELRGWELAKEENGIQIYTFYKQKQKIKALLS